MRRLLLTGLAGLIMLLSAPAAPGRAAPPDTVPFLHAGLAQQDASIAYSAEEQTVLVTYRYQRPDNGRYNLYARLLNAFTGETINEVILSAGDTINEAAVAYLPDGPSGPEYMAAFFKDTTLIVWRIDAGTGAKIDTSKTVKPAPGWDIGAIDIAAYHDPGGAHRYLLVWEERPFKFWEVHGVLVDAYGLVASGDIQVSRGVYDRGTPSAAFDYTLGKFIVAWRWRQNGGADFDIFARAVDLTGGMDSQITLTADDDGQDDGEPEVAYSPAAGRTLVVWSSEQTKSWDNFQRDIHARGIAKGSRQGLFTVASPDGVDFDPEVTADPASKQWVVVWRHDSTGATGRDIWRSTVTYNSGKYSKSSPQEVLNSAAAEENPAIALRDDGSPLIVYEDAGETYGVRTLVLALEIVAPPPAAPDALVAAAAGPAQIDLTWQDNSADETGFRVEWSADGAGGWTLLTTTGADVTAASHTGLACGAARFYRVRAERDDEVSPWSAVAAGATDACPPPALINGSFEDDADHNLLPDFWAKNRRVQLKPGEDGQDCATFQPDSGLCALRLVGSGREKRLSQVVTAAGSQGQTFTLRFWAMGQSVPDGGSYRVQVLVTHRDGSKQTITRDLPAGDSTWALYLLPITAAEDFKKVEVRLEYGRSAGTVWFDGLTFTP